MDGHPALLLGETPNSIYQKVYETSLGCLYQGNCTDLLRDIPDDCVDLIFADPPFNLGKNYGKNISDELKAEEYLAWSRHWLAECVRVVKPGGSLLVFNLPRWLIDYGAFLNQHRMLFRHWIACRMPKSFPRGKKLSPAHYGLLYYTKGEPSTFNKVYIPIPTCRHCGKEIRDYGGHRNKLNKHGLNLMDVFEDANDIWEDNNRQTEIEDLWDDIPPVRHNKYKTRTANELAPIMLERIIAATTNPVDLVLDPFGGSGTTFYAAEKLGRKWLGIEIGDTSPAIRRLSEYAAGNVVEWESARGGNGRNKRRTQQVPLFDECTNHQV